MSDSLFDIPVQLSPRLKWMEKHQVKTAEFPESDDPPFWCWCGPRDIHRIGTGGSRKEEFFVQAQTEDEAIALHAKTRGIKLWNEE